MCKAEDKGGVQEHIADGAPGTDDPMSLVRQAQTGDVAAFERLVTRHYPFIYRTAFRWLGCKTDAEDVTQTVCMRLATILPSFDGRASFTSWLYQVTLNAVRDLLRSQARVNRQAAEVASMATEGSDGDQEDALHVADIWRKVQELPEKQRDAVMLVYGEEMSHAEAARIMRCKEVTVSWHIHNARKTLRGLL
ncbi:RNA polymerase sigma factor [Azospirillum picis]|uniref:RNA polymerase sigma-70 factor (ECF subfamily) n=1 Tax=Azospirillum picis TaxID=488438 RepID=A0ABU0MQ80_9PROT|nr:sigma-70 family RNA polymerase sigma factor [Azospirillum picis]MBP2302079.1 RNA polymerase sigma-70 factor (ECF subfamily) [Azospirillum picis]MDQ0535630.1 RNA polymerase sigma-70 factor (ECF subfamily) [Azospirillum picis]